MEVLHAPWRNEYISAATAPTGEQKQGCIFCDYPRERDDEENLILIRGSLAFVMLNRYPYSSGHLMVIPYRHTCDFPSLTNEEKAELLTLAQRATQAITLAMGADGFNMGMNIGRVAGAGIDTHLHLHIVPRWNGDTNFMTVTAETRVLPEALLSTRGRLLEAWQKLF